MKKRKDYITDLIRYGTEATITIPNTVLEDNTIDTTNFNIPRTALETLKKDPELEITTEQVETDTIINITIKPDN